MSEENSPILKLLRDPACPKVTCGVLSLIQLLVFGGMDGGYTPVYSIVISALTFISSLLVIGLAVSKKLDDLPKSYFIYASVFGSLNFLTVFDNFCRVGGYRNGLGHVIAALLGIVLTFTYFVEVYRTHDKYLEKQKNAPSQKKCCCACLAKLAGRFPILMRLLLLSLSIGLIVYLELGSGYWYWYGDFYMYNFMMLFCCGVFIVSSAIHILVTKSKCFRERFDRRNLYSNGVQSALAYGLVATGFSLFGISFHRIDRALFSPIISLVIFVVTALIAGSESQKKVDETIEDRQSMLPKNLPKNIMNPVISEELKNHIAPDDIGSANPYSGRPLFIE